MCFISVRERIGRFCLREDLIKIFLLVHGVELWIVMRVEAFEWRWARRLKLINYISSLALSFNVLTFITFHPRLGSGLS